MILTLPSKLWTKSGMRGVGFTKNTQKQNKWETPYQKLMICKFQDHNKEKKLATHNEKSKKSSKEYLKDVDCSILDNFGAREENCINLESWMKITTTVQIPMSWKNLTIEMINEISYFNKGSKATDIQQILEKKFGRRLDYMSI